MIGQKILITGGSGFLGKNVIKELINTGVGPSNIISPSHSEVDFTNITQCQTVIKGVDVVIHLAAKVGGIGLNRELPGTLFYDNLLMGIQLIDEARKAGIKKFVAIGTVCAYPKFTPVPFKESSLWDGYPEETNAPYGLAKKMLLVQAQSYRQQYNFNCIYLLPVNLYGPEDNFDPSTSHVIPALIKKIIEAKNNKLPAITVWGTGKASREFLYVKDAAKAIVMATLKYNGSDPINIGSGTEITIKNLVNMINKIVGYSGDIIWDRSKPDGQPRRCLDTSRAFKEFGFRANTSLEVGLKQTIEWYNHNISQQPIKL
jgi:GDP-L-fucose synthase